MSSFPPVFPTVSGENLKGKKFQFPNDFQSKRVLILFAYDENQAETLRSWILGLDLLNRTIEWYEMPVIAKPLQIGSSFIDRGMRKGIPDERLQERVVTIYTNRQTFSDSLGIPFQRQGAYVLVVNQTGEVVGLMEGAYHAEGAKKIENWLKD